MTVNKQGVFDLEVIFSDGRGVKYYTYAIKNDLLKDNKVTWLKDLHTNTILVNRLDNKDN